MINLERARELLKAAVETQGRDFVYNPAGRHICGSDCVSDCVDGEYNTCFYEPRSDMTGLPQAATGCLVGTALTLAGETAHIGYPGSITSFYEYNPGVIDQDATVYFQRAQTFQDDGDSWGDAFDAAEHAYVLLMESE